MCFCDVRAVSDVILYFFGRGTCCIQIVNDGLILFSYIGYTLWVLSFLFFNRYSCAVPCHSYSVFSFHVVGRHCLVEIVGYFMSVCFLGGLFPYFVA